MRAGYGQCMMLMRNRRDKREGKKREPTLCTLAIPATLCMVGCLRFVSSVLTVGFSYYCSR